ncbi:type 1 fimbria pilin [Acinetobacter calcoaceticus]|uniref:Type 1 fimbria pilin n=1 Tax=Acinetobacter calcoaceticus TaxID=471 RepID=A0A4R1Y0J2_ACICA|nr:type 1 fimbria pilin [Acinetobacter calcoaceticus]
MFITLKLKQQLTLIALILSTSMALQAKEAKIDVAFRGTLIEPPPCSIDSSTPILVNFGDDIISNQVNGSNYMRPLEYKLICPENSPKGMRFRLDGSSAVMNGQSVLRAGKNGLGIAFFRSAVGINTNQWYNFNHPNVPVLTAAPTKAANANISLGSFSVIATLSIDYQ